MTQIDIENVGQPGKTYRVDAVKFAEIKRVALAILPKSAPGLTPAEVIEAVKPLLDQTLFPGGDTAGWWVKSVQLDLEAKKIITRGPKAPVRLWRL
jgi:hypothetical protein